jgi:hypothetical protein
MILFAFQCIVPSAPETEGSLKHPLLEVISIVVYRRTYCQQEYHVVLIWLRHLQHGRKHIHQSPHTSKSILATASRRLSRSSWV